MFLAPGSARASMDDLARELGMSKKTIYRHFPDKRSLLAAVLDRQFTAVERTLAAAQDAQGQPFGVRVQRFLLAAGSELGRIGAVQLAAGRGDAVLRQYVEQRVDAVVYRRLDELLRDGHRQGLLSAPPELLSEITRGALERLLTSQLPRDLDRTAADLLRAGVDTVLYGAIRPAHPGHPGIGEEQLEAVIPTARDEEVGP
ncbi:TetR/AcrR family transcriptional regulator [Streptomyces mirabilis]|uniref:TetR/AcrR family transcriptional regulator n=1 Tax=Streptomyces mirabilis TaxID=68239 RepID=UPI00368327BB